MSFLHTISLPCPSLHPFQSPKIHSILKDSYIWISKSRKDQFGSALTLRCNAVSKHNTKDYKEFVQDELPGIKKSNEIVEDVIQRLAIEVPTSSEIKENVETIRAMLKSMEDGEISISPYDTAWVALVQTQEGSPQFPLSLEWISQNQLPDGSWGEELISVAHDRIINTLACLIALKSWDVHHDQQEKGILFLKENMDKLENEKDEHMPIGFEVAFPALLEIAKNHGIEVAQNSPALQDIYAKRQLKLQRIPKEIMHTIPTTLLHSLEGMVDLDWERLLKLQSKDGSFLFSPSSTAYALMQTEDLNCLNYLNKVVQRFNGGVPNVFPIDLFEHIWVVDRLQRLGISRYFQGEIKECMNYVFRYWTEKGICWARNSEVQDIDDTAMGFRLLRLHGYKVSADVFKNFEKDGEFFCFAGQSTQAVTGMYNLLRASQLEYHGEKILEEARNFATKCLREKQASNQLLDKWIIMKDLPGEVAFALDIPWYANLPRVETRFYIEQYGGADDIWIGKTLYRMPYVNNNIYLELAKSDYNNCQALHMLEWDSILRWYMEHNFEDFCVSQRSLLLTYFLACATIFEHEKSKERLAWAKTTALVEAITSKFDKEEALYEDRKNFILEFQSSFMNQSSIGEERAMCPNKGQSLVGLLLSTLNQFSFDARVMHGRDIRSQLYQAWIRWLKTWEEEGERHKGDAELFVLTIELCAGRCIFEHNMSHPHALYLLHTTNVVCQYLGNIGKDNKGEEAMITNDTKKRDAKADKGMRKLVEIVLSNSLDGVESSVKQTCLAIAKTYYYKSYCSTKEIDYHIAKVLFQKVD